MMLSDNIESKFNKLRDFYISKNEIINKDLLKKIKNTQVSLPVRLNLSAGWNDTPPYSNEREGSILNIDYLINNRKPVKAIIKSLKRNIIIVQSGNSKKEIISDINDLLKCDNPNYDNAIVKASILASGIIPMNKECNLNDILTKTGGFKITSLVENIPIGSGLGTSSVVIASIIMAIYKSIDLKISDNDLYIKVAIAEQIMRTGGGFQDQIGAVSKGMKFIHFIPKKDEMPLIDIQQVKISNKTQKHLNEKLKIIYTGKTRLAKNILRTVMGSYIEGNQETIGILEEINNVAINMKKNIEEDDLESFGKNMINSYNLCKKMYSSFTNDDIEKIIESIKNQCYGYMIAGAGGGGYLIVLYK